MQRFVIASCLMALAFVASAQAQSYPNFVAALAANPEFSSIKEAADILGMTNTFANPQLKVTVFVPTNTAYNNALKSIPGISADTLKANKGLLQSIVYYHIVREVVKAPLPARSFETYVAGKQLTGAGNVIKGAASSANIVKPNVACGAGMAHGIDNVLMLVNLSGR